MSATSNTETDVDLSAPFRGTGGDFDYIITGAGCAGLSLLVRLIQSGQFTNKKILLVDKEPKNRNDRTWCFWEVEAGFFDPIVYKRWEKLWFHSDFLSRQLSLAPYTYKLIRGIDFYNHCLSIIEAQPNVTFLQAPVQRIFSNDAEGTGVVVKDEVYKCEFIFNSILFNKPALKKGQYWLLQHFKGWIIETEEPRFDADAGTFMDFRTNQSEGATFVYLLPFSPTKALVEYTLFTKKILPPQAYEAALKAYLKEKWALENYKIVEEEWGVIPMTNAAFPSVINNIIHLGTAGGQTKASSGYTFQFIQKQTAAIVKSLEEKAHPFSVTKHHPRFHFYDSVLLHILNGNSLRGDLIFSKLFQKNSPQQVFRFLDNETTLPEELRIISTLPTLPFLKAAIKINLPF